jgi:hypothetical protein
MSYPPPVSDDEKKMLHLLRGRELSNPIEWSQFEMSADLPPSIFLDGIAHLVAGRLIDTAQARQGFLKTILGKEPDQYVFITHAGKNYLDEYGHTTAAEDAREAALNETPEDRRNTIETEIMFGIGKKAKIDRIYELLNELIGNTSKKKAEFLVEREALEELFNLTGDIDTTVVLVMLKREAFTAEGMKNNAPFDEIARELIEHANGNRFSIEEITEKETDGMVEAAKTYADNIVQMLDNGQMVANEAVRQYCAEHLTTMLGSWQIYRLKLQKAISDQIDE